MTLPPDPDRRPSRATLGSMHWSDEESKFLKAVFTWQDEPTVEELAALRREAEAKKKVVGEFRVLVIGAKGTGKTSILTRFCDGSFRKEYETQDPFYERGCRHTVQIEEQHYMVDALEMPSKHISSNPMLEQALSITEAAVLVYDVRDQASLTLTRGIHEFIKENIGNREYGLLLVGNKNDVKEADRQVTWEEGMNMANNFQVKCAFMEVSAKTGENVADLFPALGKEILRVKRINRQRKEEEEANLLRIKSQKAATSPQKRRGLFWFFRRGTGAAVKG